MGDRGNVQIKENGSDNGVFLYTHWDGTELPKTVAKALKRGQSRWGDTPYLTRIIFDGMVDGDDGLTGYGISTQECDPNHELIVVNDGSRTVSIGGEIWTYQGFIERHNL